MRRYTLKFIFAIILFLFFTGVGNAQTSSYNQVYQYSVMVGERRSYLWVPPKSKYIRGIIISLSNLLERNWLEDPLIRKTAANENLAIIWLGPIPKGSTNLLSADLKQGEEKVLQKMLDDFAIESGYKEISDAPFISMGHSANGQFAWSVPNWNAERTIAAIAVKTVPFPDSLNFDGVPVCYVVGETTEWPQYRVPDPATRPGDRDFFWPVVRESAIKLRSVNENDLVSVVTDPGGGHFDWSEKQAKFIALYIQKACHYRLPKNMFGNKPVQLKKIKKEDGWLTDIGGMHADQFPPARYEMYLGDKRKAYWFFDKETALAAVTFNGDRKQREKQMLTFAQNGEQLPVAKQGYAPLKFQPEKDGISFKVKGDFLSEIPRELIGAGTKLGHAPGCIKFSVIDGPAIQIDSNSFRIRFNRGSQGGAIWLLTEHPGNSQYRHAVQPAQVMISSKLIEGKPQILSFPSIQNVKAGTKWIPLNARADSELPVDYYMVSGPAVIQNNKLIFTTVPVKTKWPVKITVVAYQWGRTIEPLYQTAEAIREFYLIKD
jgi:hypothetical protein